MLHILVALVAGAVGVAWYEATPIVMFLAADPVRSGLVASFARPGGNVTGLTVTTGSELYGKQLQLLKSAFPKVSQVAVVVNRASPAYADALREIGIATHALRLRQHIVEIRSPEEFEDAFAALARGADAIFVPADSMFYQYRVRLAQLAVKTRVPAMWGLREQAKARGLMAYATDLHDLARRAAIFVDKILKGAKPGDLELTRFRGHPIVGAERKVHDAEEPSAVSAGVPAADRRARP